MDYSIYIRKISDNDTDNIVLWRNRENVRKYFIYQEDFTIEGHRAWLNEVINTGKAVQFIIVKKDQDRDIGSVFIKNIDYKCKKGEFGIFIGEEDCLGKGYGTEAAKLMIQYAFEELKIHRLYLRVFAENERAISSYKNAGFELEGVLKDDAFVRGEYRDVARMAIVNSL